MSKLLKRIGTQPVLFKIEFTLKEFSINLKSQNSCKVTILIIRGVFNIEYMDKTLFSKEKIGLNLLTPLIY